MRSPGVPAAGPPSKPRLPGRRESKSQSSSRKGDPADAVFHRERQSQGHRHLQTEQKWLPLFRSLAQVIVRCNAVEIDSVATLWKSTARSSVSIGAVFAGGVARSLVIRRTRGQTGINGRIRSRGEPGRPASPKSRINRRSCPGADNRLGGRPALLFQPLVTGASSTRASDDALPQDRRASRLPGAPLHGLRYVPLTPFPPMYGVAVIIL